MKLYVARNEDGNLYLHNKRPYKSRRSIKVWKSRCISLYLNKNLFPEVKWEDPEPTEVELVMKNITNIRKK